MDIFIHLRFRIFSRRQAAAYLALLSICVSQQSRQRKRPCGTAFGWPVSAVAATGKFAWFHYANAL